MATAASISGPPATTRRLVRGRIQVSSCFVEKPHGEALFGVRRLVAALFLWLPKAATSRRTPKKAFHQKAFQRSNLLQEWGEQKSTGSLCASRLLRRVLDC